MNIHPFRTEDDYKEALREVSALVDADPAPDTPDGERLDMLATLVQAWEARHFPIGMPDPVEALIAEPAAMPSAATGRTEKGMANEGSAVRPRLT